MRKSLLAAAVGLLGVGAYALTPTPADACGGFFCGQTPVDQSAERIIFSVDERNNETTMIVQIGYSGDSDDFSWIVPMQNVPKEGSFDTFPQFAMNALDANTSPRLWLNSNCQGRFERDGLDFAPQAAGNADPSDDDKTNVTVHQREEVGPYDVVVVESDSADDLVMWLRANGYRVTSPMLPYIENYVAGDMKFLALKLQPDAKVSQIAPFQMTLPGTSPAVPLKMTALAAEPEMGVLVTVLGSQRYQPANWGLLEVPDDYIKFSSPWGGQNNWPAAVARTVDEAGGTGWVTELAGSTSNLVDLLGRTMPNDEDQAEATTRLLELMRPNAYITRMYTRLSPEEMTSDPVFRKSALGDVERSREITREYTDAECDALQERDFDPCDMVTCGAGGTCRSAENDEGRLVAACACVPGATARTSMGADGNPAVYCQDQRLSFLNPGDVEVPGEAPIPDACAGFDCGAGTCVAMNMTPTCVCDLGLVAFGGMTEDGQRQTTCTAPTTAVPRSFYDLKLPTRPLDLPEGRPDVLMPREIPISGCSAGPAPSSGIVGFLGVLGLAGLVARRRRR